MDTRKVELEGTIGARLVSLEEKNNQSAEIQEGLNNVKDLIAIQEELKKVKEMIAEANGGGTKC